MKTQAELSQSQQNIVKFLKRNKNKRDLLIATIPHVAASGMSRHIKFAVIYKGEFINITYLVAQLLGRKLSKHEAIHISGCGMDMIFATIENLYSALGEKETWRLSAVQNYRYF